MDWRGIVERKRCREGRRLTRSRLKRLVPTQTTWSVCGWWNYSYMLCMETADEQMFCLLRLLGAETGVCTFVYIVLVVVGTL